MDPGQSATISVTSVNPPSCSKSGIYIICTYTYAATLVRVAAAITGTKICLSFGGDQCFESIETPASPANCALQDQSCGDGYPPCCAGLACKDHGTFIGNQCDT